MEIVLTPVIVVLLVVAACALAANKQKKERIVELSSGLQAAQNRLESIRIEMNELLGELDELQASYREHEKQYAEQVTATNKANGKAGAMARQVNKLLIEKSELEQRIEELQSKKTAKKK